LFGLLLNENIIITFIFIMHVLHSTKTSLSGIETKAGGTPSHLATTQPQNTVKSALICNVIVGESLVIFQLLPCEDESLLVWRHAFLVIDQLLDARGSVSANFREAWIFPHTDEAFQQWSTAEEIHVRNPRIAITLRLGLSLRITSSLCRVAKYLAHSQNFRAKMIVGAWVEHHLVPHLIDAVGW
jgi:hypothetical protein